MSPLRNPSESGDAPFELESMSAWMDGELEAGEAVDLLGRLKQDEALRKHCEWLHIASDAIRSHDVAACHAPELTRKVALALQSEPVLLAPRALANGGLRRHLATGVTLAAAAAVLVVVALPQLHSSNVPDAPVAAAQPVAKVVASASRSGAPASRSPQLEAYFRAHRELETTGVMPTAVAYIRSSGEPDR